VTMSDFVSPVGSDRAMAISPTTRRTIAVAMGVMLVGVAAAAQPAPAPAAPPPIAPSPAPGPAPGEAPVSTKPPSPAASKPGGPPAAASGTTDQPFVPFNPSQKISPDLGVSFPTDI